MFISCKKDNNIAISPEPIEASLIRNLVFVNQTNVEKNVSYGKAVVTATTGVDDSMFYIRLNTTNISVNTANEYITLYINQSNLQSTLAKGYTFGTAEPALKRIYYSYSFKESNTSSWSSNIDSKIGVVFEGLLNITNHNTQLKTIDGSFIIKAKRMNYDPTVNNIANPVDPLNTCDLIINGSFKNVRIQQ
ncbi:MAG: hypothetical protein ACOVNY_00100 [Chitinophagaceae bacterium]